MELLEKQVTNFRQLTADYKENRRFLDKIRLKNYSKLTKIRQLNSL